MRRRQNRQILPTVTKTASSAVETLCTLEYASNKFSQSDVFTIKIAFRNAYPKTRNSWVREWFEGGGGTLKNSAAIMCCLLVRPNLKRCIKWKAPSLTWILGFKICQSVSFWVGLSNRWTAERTWPAQKVEKQLKLCRKFHRTNSGFIKECRWTWATPTIDIDTLWQRLLKWIIALS